jgi:chromosome partitioning protein
MPHGKLSFLGTAELAELFKVSKQTVANWRGREDFPAPVAELKSGPVWDQRDVLLWAEQHAVATRGLVRKSLAVTVALMNMKGGVGKSTLTANLGWFCSAQKLRVLLIDLDPQFNLSQYALSVEVYEKLIKEDHATVLDLFEQVGVTAISKGATKRKPGDFIYKVTRWTNGGKLDIVPSRLELAWTLKNPQFKEKPLEKFVKAVAQEYDLILIDCSPTESILTEAAYLATDFVLVPIKPDFLSTIGLPLLARSLADFKERNETSDVRIAGVLFNATSPYKPEQLRSKKDVHRVAEKNGWYVFQHEVSQSDSYPKGARMGKPIFRTEYARWDKITEFSAVGREFMGRVGLAKS